MTDVTQNETSAKKVMKEPSRRTPKPSLSLLERLTSEDLQSLRLDDESRMEFDIFARRFKHSRAELYALEAEDTDRMDDDRFSNLSAAEAGRRNSGMAVVYFLAPRILKLREGEAKRKWRLFLSKFRKEERLI